MHNSVCHHFRSEHLFVSNHHNIMIIIVILNFAIRVDRRGIGFGAGLLFLRSPVGLTRIQNFRKSESKRFDELLGGMLTLQPIYRPGPQIPRPFPGEPTVCHHAASMLSISTIATARFFGTTNYGTISYIVSGDAFGPLHPKPAPN